MKCEEVSKELIGYLDRRANSAERKQVEEHLVLCSACRTRAEEFRNLWTMLEEVPAIEPSFGFDARVRQRVAAEPRPQWFRWFVPQPRLAFAMALLVALSVWMANLPQLPQRNSAAVPAPSMASENEQFQAIKDLGVLDNYEVLTKFDALSELTPTPVQHPEKPQQNRPAAGNGGA
jgi:anti-sigma factor RsiW